MKKQRMMARPIAPTRKSRRPLAALLAIVAVIASVGAVGVSGILAGGPSGKPGASLVAANSTPGSVPDATFAPAEPSDAPSRRPARTPDTSPTLEPTGGGPKPAKTPVPAASRAPTDGGAPTSPAEFDLEGQGIDIAFPLRADTRYHYRDNFLETREGAPDDYNHARVNDEGLTHRLHDGIDVYASEGEPLVATFSGTVIDAGSRWQPWEPDRYGNTIVIVSDEPGTVGYMSIYVHCDRVWVEPGTHVARGQIVGTLGRTGNAETQSIRAHLHFELRAPFLLDWSPMGEGRALDAFNPYPSLVVADPKRS